MNNKDQQAMQTNSIKSLQKEINSSFRAATGNLSMRVRELTIGAFAILWLFTNKDVHAVEKYWIGFLLVSCAMLFDLIQYIINARVEYVKNEICEILIKKGKIQRMKSRAKIINKLGNRILLWRFNSVIDFKHSKFKEEIIHTHEIWFQISKWCVRFKCIAVLFAYVYIGYVFFILLNHTTDS